MAKTLNVRFQQRVDTAANWTSVNPELLPGEIGVESDTSKFKFGQEGVNWNDLPYAGIDENQLAAIEDNFTKVVPTTKEDGSVQTDEEALATIENPTKGDMAVVERVIGGISSATSLTAYVYNGSAWAAMDGNYSAANVYTSSKITLAGDYGQDSRKDKITSIGNLRIGDEIAAGTSLQSLLMDMLSQRLQPSITANPSATIKLYNGSGTSEVGAVEVGTTITPRYVATLDDGSYTYEATTGVSATSYAVTSTGRKTVNGATDATTEDSASVASGTFSQFTVDDDTSYKLSVSIKHSAGNIAKDNLGDPSEDSIQIAAGTKTDDSTTVTGYRAWFCGYKNGDNALADATAITGAQVRALGNSANGSWKSSMSVTKMKQMFFAAPAGKGYKPVIKDASTTAPQTVLGPITVSVEGANSFDAIDYDVWYVANADAASGSATLNITKT